MGKGSSSDEIYLLNLLVQLGHIPHDPEIHACSPKIPTHDARVNDFILSLQWRLLFTHGLEVTLPHVSLSVALLPWLHLFTVRCTLPAFLLLLEWCPSGGLAKSRTTPGSRVYPLLTVGRVGQWVLGGPRLQEVVQ